jgi:hypothetical protein
MSGIATADGGAWEVAQEEFIATCMKAAGFVYYPDDVEPLLEEGESAIRVGDRRLQVPWLPDDPADVERYGYGHYESGDVVYQASPGPAAETDRNAEYVASLGAAAQREYQVALMGAGLADYVLRGVDADVPLPELGGCMGGADEAHPMPMVQAMEESPTTLYEDLIYQMLDEAADPYAMKDEWDMPSAGTFLRREQIDALDTAWRECVAEDLPEFGWASVVGVATSEFDGPTGAWDSAVRTNPEGEPWSGASGEEPLEYRSLTGTPREISIAVADFRCRRETDYVDRFLAIEREAQEEFIAAHKSELDEMAAALEAYINGA